jgi:hypothetical protein
MKHGKNDLKVPGFNSWHNMIARCTYPAHPSYKYYGAIGIAVCERWFTFANFIADMGPKPTRAHSLDRLNKDVGYCPENCRWATRKEQDANLRRSVRLTLNGVTRSIPEWSDVVGIRQITLRCRKQMGWSDERTLTTPINETAQYNGLSTKLAKASSIRKASVPSSPLLQGSLAC